MNNKTRRNDSGWTSEEKGVKENMDGERNKKSKEEEKCTKTKREKRQS